MQFVTYTPEDEFPAFGYPPVLPSRIYYAADMLAEDVATFPGLRKSECLMIAGLTFADFAPFN